METLIPIFVLVAILFLVIAYFANEAAKKRRAAFAALATQLGFTYYEEGIGAMENSSFLGMNFSNARDTIVKTFEMFPLFNEGEDRRAAPVLVGERNGVHYYLFDYRFVTESTNSKGESSRTTHEFSVLTARTPFLLPSLNLAPQNFLDNIGKVFGRREIEVESEEFNRRFFIQSVNQKETLDLLHPRALEQLMTCEVRHWQFAGMYMLTYRPGRWDPNHYVTMLAEAESFLDLVPVYVRQDQAVPRPFHSPLDGLV